MKGLVVALSLLATAAVWWAALALPKDPDRPPDAFLGRFRVERLDVEEGKPLPYPPGQLHDWEFFEDGTFLMRVRAANGQELFRREGVVKIGEADEEPRAMEGGTEPVLVRVHPMTLRIESQNRAAVADLLLADEDRAALGRAQHFEAVWTRDEFGPLLILANFEAGYRLVLRSDAPAAPPP